MTAQELYRLKAQRAVLAEVAELYYGRTIENIIDNIDARIKNYERLI